MNRKFPLWMPLIVVVLLVSTACRVSLPSDLSQTGQPAQPTSVLPNLAENGLPGSAEGPVLLRGSLRYTNEFVTETYYVEHAVALIDLTGFVLRDKEWELPVKSQVLGYMDLNPEANSATFILSLPALPLGEFNDVDQDLAAEKGVQVFAVAYSPNLIDGPFSEGDDRSLGWPSYFASIKADPENQDEITGGRLVVWAPDDQQSFPSGFGADGLLFTADDPSAPLPAGYSVIDLDQNPFKIMRDREVDLVLYEPADVAIKDFSAMSYSQAFDTMFETVKKEYAFTDVPGKAPNWDALYSQISPLVKEAERQRSPKAYYDALRLFTYAFKDGHVNVSAEGLTSQAYSQSAAYGYGFAARELDDGRVIVVFVTPGGPAAQAGLQVGDQLQQIGGQPVSTAIGQVQPFTAPFSTDFGLRYEQVRYLSRAPEGTPTTLVWRTASGAQRSAALTAVVDFDGFNATSPFSNYDPNALPVDFRILESNLGYVRVNSNYDDLNLLLRLFERALQTFELNEVEGVIIDMRLNFGGAPLGLAGYLTGEEIPLGQKEYYSDVTGKFEPDGLPDKVLPSRKQFRFNSLALLVDQTCFSACEIEAYAFSQVPGILVIGQYPTAGVEAEVSRGQFTLPGGIELQVPTGRFLLPDGSVFLEGVGVQPALRVPIDETSVLSGEDVVLQTAEQSLLNINGQ
jgi:C-terminal processing protease CtpA/Prc